MAAITETRRRHPPTPHVWRDLYEAVEAMLVGDCLQWRCTRERFHTLGTSVARRARRAGTVVRCLWQDDVAFLVRVA